MNHRKVYKTLIDNRLADPLPKEEYGEVHHIVPVAEGGSDNASNKVRLSAREHYIAHLLLAKTYDDLAMYSAVMYMQCKSSTQERAFRFNSRLYERIRKEFGAKRREYLKQHPLIGPKNGMYGKHHTEESKKKISDNKKGQRTWLGKHHTEESKKKMSRSHKGKPLTEEQKNKLKAAFARPDVKARRSASISKALKGSFWVTDGKTNHFLSKGSTIPEGFYVGRTINSKSTTGYRWYNNGVENMLAKDCPGEGWQRGRL